MAAEALETALGAGGTDLLLHWLLEQGEMGHDSDVYSCTRSEFVTYFLCYLRSQTESIVQTNANALQILQHQSTPEKLLSQKKSQTADTDNSDVASQSALSVKNDRRRTSASPSRDKAQKKTGRRVKTKLFNENDSGRNTQEINETEFQNMVLSSTPMKSNHNFNLPLNSPVTPVETYRSSSKLSHSDSSRERCDTPRISHSRHSGRMSSEKSINLGDYITNASKVSTKKKKSHKSTPSHDSTADASSSLSLDLSSSDMFPEIGAKRRIKPTNIEHSKCSTGSFTSFSSDFQPPTLAFQENSAFEQEKFQPKELSESFNTERSILKRERHKLMEKFNILNTTSPVKIPMTPQIKDLRSNSTEKVHTYIEADVSKVSHEDKLESISQIYNGLLNNNLVLSISAEVYFMISIVLSKQITEDYENVERNLKEGNVIDFIIKSVHNSSYVAIKTLWTQRHILEIMLDKFSMKLLGENKRVRSFYPELAKHLLNLYSLKCEGEMYSGKEENGVIFLENRFANGVVCFNSETDSVDNFPSILSFHNFKKQRDMFYEIHRWWSDSGNQSLGSARTLLRSRVKSLLSLAVVPANHAHLARLLVHHMLADCVSNSHESKLSKLQRRLTGPAPTPASADTHRLPHFTAREEFYRDFLLVAESESFRTHARDALACELCSLDAACLPSCDERQESSSIELKQEYLASLKRLRVLAKFLGLLVAAPHQTTFADGTKTAVPSNKAAPPKEKVLRSEISLRCYSQPLIDLQAILETAFEKNRLSVTIPWLILYLAMMDFVCLRIRSFDRLLSTVFSIYRYHLTNDMNRGIAIFLKLCLSWLFELPHFPQEKFYETRTKRMKFLVRECGVDGLELIDESVLAEVCPYLKEINVLLLTSQPSGDKEGSTFRHITPVTVTLNSADRAMNKERELQARLEQELLRSMASSTRRVLDLVTERVTSATLKELSGSVLTATRLRCREQALRIVRESRGDTQVLLLGQLRRMYDSRLALMRAAAAKTARASVAARARTALSALLPGGGTVAPLVTLARRSSLARVDKWLADNWASAAVLCKDIEAEMSHLLLLGDSFLAVASPALAVVEDAVRTRLTLPDVLFTATCVSPAEMIIDIKETICQLIEYSATPLDVAALLSRARVCCHTENVFITATSRKAVLQLSVELLLVLVSRKPLSATESLLEKFDSLWNDCCPNRPQYETLSDSTQDEDLPFNLRDFAAGDDKMTTPVSSDDEDTARPVRIIIDTSPVVNRTSDSIVGLSGKNRLCTDSIKWNWSDGSTMPSSLSDNFGTDRSRIDKSNDIEQSKTDKCNDMDRISTGKCNDMVKSGTDECNNTDRISTGKCNDMDRSGIEKCNDIDRYGIDKCNDMDRSDTDKCNDTDRSGTDNWDDADRPKFDKSKAENTENAEELLDLFNRMLCPRNVVILGESRCEDGDVWTAMANVLIFLLRKSYLSEDSLTEQCLAVYRQDWPQSVLECLSCCMRTVSVQRGSAGGKFTLFLDFLAEFCGDMDRGLTEP